MRVVIAGGHGKIALRLESALAKRGDEPVALIRDPGQCKEVMKAGAEPLLADLEAMSGAEIAATIGPADAVLFAAGAGPGSGPERKETVDYGAAVKMIEAAFANGIRRFLMISAMRADPEHRGDQVFDVYLRAKGKADAVLRESGLGYTILRPGRLTDDPGTGRVALAATVMRGEVSREDVAAVLAALLDGDRAINATLELVGGEIPIEDAVAGL